MLVWRLLNCFPVKGYINYTKINSTYKWINKFFNIVALLWKHEKISKGHCSYFYWPIKNGCDFFFCCQHQQSYILHNYLWKLSDLLASLNDNKICILFLLYLSSAIERTDHEILLSCHEHDFGICGTALNWFWSCLSDRKQYVLVNNQKSTATSLDFGVPQAFVLSPVLFILYTTYRLHHKALCHERERERECVCVCVCACVRVWVHVHACVGACMHVSPFLVLNVHMHVILCVYVCMCVCACTHVCVYSCINMLCMNMYIIDVILSHWS